LRTGAVDGRAFAHVIIVGHSLGSIEALIEAARYHDVDAMIVTGAPHALTPSAPAFVQNDFYPAASDPKFASPPSLVPVVRLQPAQPPPDLVTVADVMRPPLTTAEEDNDDVAAAGGTPCRTVRACRVLAGAIHD
jgi:pimeloyl-ACP methyl ester carboxylesterase